MMKKIYGRKFYIEVDDETKRVLEQVKKRWEKEHGKILWKDFMDILEYQLRHETYVLEEDKNDELKK